VILTLTSDPENSFSNGYSCDELRAANFIEICPLISEEIYRVTPKKTDKNE